MGSFRIVTGSGWNRREIKNVDSVAKFFRETRKKIVQESYEHQSSSGASAIRADTARTSRAMINYIAQDAQAKILRGLQTKATKWAKETAAEFRASVPVDTGNLRDSIEVLRFTVSKNSITASVGVNKRKIVRPPTYMRNRKGYMKLMPDYDYSPYVIGQNTTFGRTSEYVVDSIGRGRATSYGGNIITSRFSKIAKKNAKKIISKK